MTAAFIPKKLYMDRFHKLICVPHNIPKLQIKKICPYFEDAKAELIFRFVRASAPAYTEFKRLMEQALTNCSMRNKEEYFAKSPLIVPLKGDITRLRVYPNIILEQSDPQKMKDCFVFADTSIVKTMLDNYQAEKDDVNKSAKWASVNRVWRSIKRHEDLPVSRVFARFLKFSGCTEAAVAKLAVEFDSLRKPLELKFADTHEQMIEMYSSGPTSCMAIRKTGEMAAGALPPTLGAPSSEARWAWMVFKYNVHPCSFFVYHPCVRGVYTMRGERVAARTFIYQQENGNWQYGRVYYENEKIKEQFITTLTTQGITPLVGTSYTRNVQYHVPGLYVKELKDYILPVPYFDNFHGPCHVDFDDTTKNFIVSTDPKLKTNIQTGSRVGYVQATGLVFTRCEYCGENISGNSQYKITAADGSTFCNKDHMRHAGYIQAWMSDQSVTVVPRIQCIVDCLNPHEGFTTEQAAKDNDAFPYIHDFNDHEDNDHRYTKHGTFVEIAGQIYSVGNAQTDYRIDKTKQVLHGKYVYKLLMDDEDRPINDNFKVHQQRVVQIEHGFTPFQIAA